MNSENNSPFSFCSPLMESLADGVFAVDMDWKIRVFNRAAEQITGISREDAIGNICCEVFRASICETKCALKQAMDTGKPVIDRTIYIIDNEGQRVPVSISAAVIRDEKGQVVGGVETFRDLSREESLRQELARQFTFHDIISRSAKMIQIFNILKPVADSRSSVLITGESGTGKELTARAIHASGSGASEPFVAVNCGALPDTLLESELFGYKRGAFTDARQDKPGRFALAGKGTLFLDEIGDVSQAVQVKLLRVLQEGVYEPLGATVPEQSHARIITATNQSLEDRVADGLFREDLYYRINVVNIDLPPLRERIEDVPLLVEHFIRHFNTIQRRNLLGIADDALTVLMNYDFPGNIRELRNIVERAFIICREGMIHNHHLPDKLLKIQDKPLAGKGMTLQEMERIFIQRSLDRNNGSMTAAARELGIHRATLYRKVRAYKIQTN